MHLHSIIADVGSVSYDKFSQAVVKVSPSNFQTISSSMYMHLCPYLIIYVSLSLTLCQLDSIYQSTPLQGHRLIRMCILQLICLSLAAYKRNCRRRV